MSNQPDSHFFYLDSLRGLAAFSVVLSHFVGAYSLSSILGWVEYSPLHMVYDGFAAVSLFFVLSGFVLSLRLFDPSSEGNPVLFLIGRFFRVYPPFFVILVLCAVLAQLPFWTPDSTPISSTWLREFWKAGLTWEVVRDQAFFRIPEVSQPNYMPQAWTLGIELLLSSLIPYLVVFTKKGWVWILSFLVLLFAFFNPSEYLAHFMLGVLLAKHARSVQAWWSKTSSWPKYAVLVLGFLLYSYRATAPLLVGLAPEGQLSLLGANRTIWFVTGVGSVLIIALVFVSRSCQRPLEWPILRFLGSVSYSVYLIHFAVLITVVPWAIWVSNLFGLSSSASLGVGLLALLATTTGLAIVSHRLLEKPSIHVGRLINSFLRKRHHD